MYENKISFQESLNQAIKNGTFDEESGDRFPFHEDDLKYSQLSRAVTFWCPKSNPEMEDEVFYCSNANSISIFKVS